MEHKMKVALVIGHSKCYQGAKNELYNETEYEFNKELVKRVAKKIDDAIIIERYSSYGALPHIINSKFPNLVVSFHANAFDKNTSGSEVLYWHSSEKGRLAAARLQAGIVHALGLRDRGIKPKQRKARGGLLLEKTNAPCVIIEPFFIDNDNDYRRAAGLIDVLAHEIAESIKDVGSEIF